jgi:hypothetical protein
MSYYDRGTDQIVFQGRNRAPAAVGTVLFGAVVLWVPQQSKGLTPTSGGIAVAAVALVVAVVWAALLASRRLLRFSRRGAEAAVRIERKEEIDLRRVSRLVCRIVVRGNAGSYAMYIAVLPEGEIELFDRKAYRDLPRILQLLEARTGRAIEEERKHQNLCHPRRFCTLRLA